MQWEGKLGHLSVKLFPTRRDSDNIPMRQLEWEVYLGNFMWLGSMTFSFIKHSEAKPEELRL